MAEAEDVLHDLARHATVYARSAWQRHRGPRKGPPVLALADVAPRLDLLMTAMYGQAMPMRIAQPPALPTALSRLFRRHDVRQIPRPVPATDGHSIWLPAEITLEDQPDAPATGFARYRLLALLQATRARRGSAVVAAQIDCPITRALYLLFEAEACDHELVNTLPGLCDAVGDLRREALARRPAVAALPTAVRCIEELAQEILRSTVPGGGGEAVTSTDRRSGPWPATRRGYATPRDSLSAARHIATQRATTPGPHIHALFLDAWTGDLLQPPATGDIAALEAAAAEHARGHTPRSARLPRRPRERQAREDEDQQKQGAWMIQTGEPLEKAEDPFGMQRPIDRDQDTSADEYADALSELAEARLVADARQAKEVLLSDDPPNRQSLARLTTPAPQAATLTYPEWDYRIEGYRHPGATVHLIDAPEGAQSWLDATLARHHSLLHAIRGRFDMLRGQRQWLRRQSDGDEIDLDAYIEGRADAHAGLPIPQGLYRVQRRQARDLTIMLLVDNSGSTDAWLSGRQRIIDIEREALLLVAIALQHLGDPYAIHTFSGEGPQGVTASALKHFNEPYSPQVGLRIAGIEPQHYTRTGAALRHATALLMRQPAQHRLLILLSDGKPNDADHYEGRYGIADTRRAVEEARAQGIFPFCLTIDRQAARYLPHLFGPGQYALLGAPHELPRVLLEWMRRLVCV
ncbi:VWA domain-containing protein [Pusillimonas sp. TS35]|uniref:nitric oxide reductase activation protein NorD n=1 Tax=Paracandidimonas lactea TaxID=2895524 RepID=UPI00136D1848|nr:VWA domain-containing protein [Paracandidimonas lactea]MYN15052.1 VWA domain-containing protein [Pusillimonas sp. TS35]